MKISILFAGLSAASTALDLCTNDPYFEYLLHICTFVCGFSACYFGGMTSDTNSHSGS